MSPAMGEHNGAGNRQAHASSLAELCALLAAVELLEDVRQVDFVDAGSVVFHFKFQSTLDAPAAQHYAAFRRRIAARRFQSNGERPG